MAEEYIWIARWEEFQHYRLQRGKRPAWIKFYTRQLFDDAYRRLTASQRALLHETRAVHAANNGRTTAEPRALTQLLGRRVTKAQIEALNRAGFIELISRETLEQRLEKLYSDSRQEVEVEVKPPNPLSGTTNTNTAKAKLTCHICGIEHKTSAKMANHLRNVHDFEGGEADTPATTPQRA